MHEFRPSVAPRPNPLVMNTSCGDSLWGGRRDKTWKWELRGGFWYLIIGTLGSSRNARNCVLKLLNILQLCFSASLCGACGGEDETVHAAWGYESTMQLEACLPHGNIHMRYHSTVPLHVQWISEGENMVMISTTHSRVHTSAQVVNDIHH